MERRYEVVESKTWKATDGRTASIFGSLPWTTEADRANWSIVVDGYTVRDHLRNTVGLGRRPFETQAEAQVVADKLESLRVRS